MILECKYFHRRSKVNRIFAIFATDFENSDGYCGFVERNRQIFETKATRSCAIIGALCFVFQCLVAFGDALSTWKEDGVRCFFVVSAIRPTRRKSPCFIQSLKSCARHGQRADIMYTLNFPNGNSQTYSSVSELMSAARALGGTAKCVGNKVYAFVAK